MRRMVSKYGCLSSWRARGRWSRGEMHVLMNSISSGGSTFCSASGRTPCARRGRRKRKEEEGLMTLESVLKAAASTAETTPTCLESRAFARGLPVGGAEHMEITEWKARKSTLTSDTLR
jgi:hypothetical protein